MGILNMTNEIIEPSCMRTTEKGFSLIEVAIALIIIGLFVGSAITTYNVYMAARRDIDTKARVNTIEAALSKYLSKRGVYPLPADRSKGPGQTGFGRAVATAPVTLCSSSMGTVCTTAGATPVYIGDVPFASLGIHYSNASDSYGRKFTYAVTGTLTTGTFDNSGGRIQVLNENGSVAYAGTEKAHYFVVSHGPDGQGGYTLAGQLFRPCGTVAANGRDVENCNGDITFRNNRDTTNTTKTTYMKPSRYYATSTAAQRAIQFDDWTGHKATQSVGMWALVPGPGNLIATQTNRNILVGTPSFTCTPAPCVDLPKTRVEVQGTMRGDALRTNRICYDSSSGCPEVTALDYPKRPKDILTPGHFAGATPAVSDPATTATTGTLGILCGNYSPMRGWQYGDELCSTSAVVANPAGYGDCNTTITGLYPTGVDAAGHTICN